MNNAAYWVFFGLMPATFILLGWAAEFYNRWSIQADRRKAKAGEQPAGGANPPA